MTIRQTPTRAVRLAACALAFAAGASLAQPSGPAAVADAPASGASASAPAPPAGPRLRTPAEIGNRATVPGDLRPERPVTPQINIPFGKSPPPPPAPGQREERLIKRPTTKPTPASGGVDDAAARCESQVDDQLRAACRAKLSREAKGRSPS